MNLTHKYIQYTLYFDIYLQEALHETVPVIFCLATEIADDEQRAKINRVLSLWETNSYLPVEVLVKMRPPESGKFLAEWKESQSKVSEFSIFVLRKISSFSIEQYDLFVIFGH